MLLTRDTGCEIYSELLSSSFFYKSKTVLKNKDYFQKYSFGLHLGLISKSVFFLPHYLPIKSLNFLVSNRYYCIVCTTNRLQNIVP